MQNNIIKRAIQKTLNFVGYKIISRFDSLIDNDEIFGRIYDSSKDYTMTSKEKMYSLYRAVLFIINSKIEGDFVECGVWRGGSAMLIAQTLIELNVINRKIYLYDTFEGMTEPKEEDYNLVGIRNQAKQKWEKTKMHNGWCYASLQEVQANMALTKYPREQLVFVKGKVEETIPKQTPIKISLLRLDTDWYESTKHELVHLFPLLTKNGVLILDDYGFWMGSKKAVDEYFTNKPILLNKIDESGMIGLKTE